MQRSFMSGFQDTTESVLNMVDHCLHVCSALDQDPDSCSGAFSGTSGHSQEPGSRGGADSVLWSMQIVRLLWVDLQIYLARGRKKLSKGSTTNHNRWIPQVKTQDGPQTMTRIATALLGSSVIQTDRTDSKIFWRGHSTSATKQNQTMLSKLPQFYLCSRKTNHQRSDVQFKMLVSCEMSFDKRLKMSIFGKIYI